MHGWCILTVKIDAPNRYFVVVGRYNIIQELKTNLKQRGKFKKSDELEQCINTIFKNGDIVDINDDNTMDAVADYG